MTDRIIAELRRLMPRGQANDNDDEALAVEGEPPSADYLRGYKKGLEAAIILLVRWRGEGLPWRSETRPSARRAGSDRAACRRLR